MSSNELAKPLIEGVNHITLTVSDLDLAFTFYRDVLGLKALAKRKNKSAYFLAGANWIALVWDKNKEASCSERSYAHLAFSVSSDNFQMLTTKIKNSGAKIWQENSSHGESLYFLDTSGNRLEIHTGSWESRISWLKEHDDPEVEVYV